MSYRENNLVRCTHLPLALSLTHTQFTFSLSPFFSFSPVTHSLFVSLYFSIIISLHFSYVNLRTASSCPVKNIFKIDALFLSHTHITHSLSLSLSLILSLSLSFMQICVQVPLSCRENKHIRCIHSPLSLSHTHNTHSISFLPLSYPILPQTNGHTCSRSNSMHIH